MRYHRGREYEDLVRLYLASRRDSSVALIEGFHALKHALRFGALIKQLLTRDRSNLEQLTSSLASDLSGKLSQGLIEIPDEAFRRLSPIQIPTGVAAIAKRPLTRVPTTGRLILLEEPQDLTNVGAAIRVAAAAGAGGVIVTGRKDPWAPEAIRASVGLHWALNHVGRGGLPDNLPLIALDPDEGEILRPGLIPKNALIAFGSERRGLSRSLLGRAEKKVRIPMRAGVSSLNLATAVAVTLYSALIGGESD